MSAGPGPAAAPMDEWKIRTARGKEYSYDSEEEALAELSGYEAGATVWKRRVHRGFAFTTTSPDGWQQVH